MEIATPAPGVGQREGDSDLMSHEPDNHENASSGGISRRDVIKKGAAGAAAGLALPSLITATASAARPAPAPTRRTRSRRASGSPATVRFWTWYLEQEDQMPQVIADFEEANPNITVEMRLITDVEGAYLPALLAAAAGDDLPEIYAPHVHSVEFGRQGLAADLNAELGADFIAEFFPSCNSMFVLGDAQYAIGWMAQTMGIYYDSEMFAAAGIDGEPETWDEMIEAANLIKSNLSGNLGVMQQADNGFSVCDTWFPMITLYSDDPDTLRQLDERDGATWTDQAVVDSLTLYQRTIDEGLWQENMTGMNNDACLERDVRRRRGGLLLRFMEPADVLRQRPARAHRAAAGDEDPDARNRRTALDRQLRRRRLLRFRTQPEQGRRPDVHRVPLLAGGLHQGDDRFVVDAGNAGRRRAGHRPTDHDDGVVAARRLSPLARRPCGADRRRHGDGADRRQHRRGRGSRGDRIGGGDA